MQVTAGGPPISVSVVVVDPAAAVSHVDPAVAVTRVIPVLELAYIEIASSVYLDDSGLYQYKADIAVVVDSTAIAFSRQVGADFFALSDTAAIQTTKSFTDSVGLSDVCIPMLVYLRDFADSVVFTDAAVSSFAKNPSDTVLTTDGAPVFSTTKLLTDAFAMNDMADIGDGIAFDFQDYTNNVVSVSDSSVITSAPGVADSLAATDTSTLLTSPAYFETLSASDTIVLSTAPVYADATVLTDNLSIASSQAFSDSVGQSDTPQLATFPSVADSISQTDAGLVIMQDYVDPTYLAEDYVGVSYAF